LEEGDASKTYNELINTKKRVAIVGIYFYFYF
jgi:hypothetical protein